jgi:NADH-quinone oxidoreductase subunit L
MKAPPNAALPFVTAGFYSKDEIIWYAFASDKGSIWLWLAAFGGAFITSIYTFRMVFHAFFGEQKTQISYVPGNRIKIPLIILGILSLVAGFIELPEWMGHFAPFSKFLNTALPAVSLAHVAENTEMLLQSINVIFSLLGVWLAWRFYKKPQLLSSLQTGAGARLSNFLFSGWKFDWFYDHVLVRPVVWLSRIDKTDFIEKIYGGIGGLNIWLNKVFSRTENGNIRWYTMGVALGAVITLTIILFL